MYKVNPDSYASVFALPTEIADKHLRMAGKAQLKVLLWLYRNPAANADIAVISRDTGIPGDEIDDAMLYWIEAGLVVKNGEKPQTEKSAETVFSKESATEMLRKSMAVPSVPVKSREDTPSAEPKKQEKERATLVKPSIQDIARRMGESEEIRSMFNEAQDVFGRTLGYDAQSSLLILHDHYALPAEVIVMLCNYARNIGKHDSLAYIVRIGISWAENGINTFETASNKISRMENADRHWSDLRRVTGLENPKPTVKQSEFLEIWINDYGFDTEMIAFAYDRAVEKKGTISFSYMNGILRKWHEKGFRTVEEIERAEKEFADEAEKNRAAKTQQKAPAAGKGNYAPPSFDVELALKRSLALDPTKTKKGQ